MVEDYSTIDSCRICDSPSLYEFLDLGNVPPVNNFKETSESKIPEYPLEVVFCEDCNHVQLRNTVRRDLLFEDYSYFSSSSTPLIDHFGEYADSVENKFLDAGDLVVEVGSNDGVLLRQFSEKVRKLGVEPAENVAEKAREQYDLDVCTDFFSLDIAKDIASNYGFATVIAANNVLGHVDELHDIVAGVDYLLQEQGVFVVEVPYLIDLLNHVEFDTIYHEHISYFSIRPLTELFEKFKMEIFDVERVDVHGGSVRLFVQRESGTHSITNDVAYLSALEKALGLNERTVYDEFREEVRRRRQQLKDLLEHLDETGHSIVGYGAPGKGNVLLNYCDIGPDLLDYIVDTTPSKQGTFSPGKNIPVRPPSEFGDPYPDVALLLAWNYRESILEKEEEFRGEGGRFLIPAPNVDIV